MTDKIEIIVTPETNINPPPVGREWHAEHRAITAGSWRGFGVYGSTAREAFDKLLDRIEEKNNVRKP